MSKAIFVQGLAYGDEAKGATVDFLCRQLPVDLIVRFNGGSQAAHNVVTSNGTHHTFSQFGSGKLACDGVRTHLSRFMLVNPLTMMHEMDALALAYSRVGLGCSLTQNARELWSHTTVDPRCAIITPFHQRLNRLREERRGADRHGNCGQGVGVVREWQLKYGDDVLYAGDLTDFEVTKHKLRFLEDLLAQEVGAAVLYDKRENQIDKLDLTIDYYNWTKEVRFSETLPTSDLAVFEGAQGVLLDETHGVAPHNTWTDCTFANADTLCAEAGVTDRFRIGSLRTYLTRHGAGPFVDFGCYGYGGISEEHNEENHWQGAFRSGPMDFDLARKAIRHIGRLDCIALSHLDACVDGAEITAAHFGVELGVPIGIVAVGPTANHRKFTPAWSTAWQRILESRS